MQVYEKERQLMSEVAATVENRLPDVEVLAVELGRLEDDYVLASETCAFDLIGAEPVRELQDRKSVV